MATKTDLPIIAIFKSEHLTSKCTIVQFISATNPILISAICSCYACKRISYWPQIPNLRKDDNE